VVYIENITSSIASVVDEDVVSILCHVNMCTELLPRSGCLWLHYSSLQTSCHNMIIVPGFGGEDTGIVELGTAYQIVAVSCQGTHIQMIGRMC
jgi:hypothetical protein